MKAFDESLIDSANTTVDLNASIDVDSSVLPIKRNKNPTGSFKAYCLDRLNSMKVILEE